VDGFLLCGFMGGKVPAELVEGEEAVMPGGPLDGVEPGGDLPV